METKLALPRPLADSEKRLLLQVARAAAEQELANRPPAVSGSQPLRVAGRFGGAFVSYYNGPALRGCVGTFGATEDLANTVELVARSALRDSRFENDPITPAEMPRLDIEVSVLSDLVQTQDPLSLIVGSHGVRVALGVRAGCFLPKVALERNWSAQEFLSNCCTMKAGLPADAWRDVRCEVALFQAEAFRESQHLASDSGESGGCGG